MYKVYLLLFESKKESFYVYVGCSNNLQRRTHQHNENARLGKSKLGLFLKDNDIVLEEKDFIILHKNSSRSKALSLENNLIRTFDKNGIKLLNDSGTINSTRKGKRNYDSRLEWVVVDFKNNITIETNSLREYCLKNNLSYQSLHATSKNKPHSYKNQYKVFKKEVWLKLTKKEKNEYLSGSFLKKIYDENLKNHIKRNAKTYKVEHPNGKIEIVTNLDKFAREHKINAGNLHSSISNNYKAKGYKAYRIE